MTAIERREGCPPSDLRTTTPASTPCDPIARLRECHTGREFALCPSRRRFRIGSSPACDVVLDDPFVSAEHCVIEQRPPGRTAVRDQRSTNGTFINGNRIELAELRPEIARKFVRAIAIDHACRKLLPGERHYVVAQLLLLGRKVQVHQASSFSF